MLTHSVFGLVILLLKLNHSPLTSLNLITIKSTIRTDLNAPKLSQFKINQILNQLVVYYSHALCVLVCERGIFLSCTNFLFFQCNAIFDCSSKAFLFAVINNAYGIAAHS